MKINLLDLFSGIGGFSKGLSQAGFKIDKHYTSEIDKHAKAIYKRQFRESIEVGDVRHVRANDLERIDAITFGSPCQDFSLAGNRKGMDGERSSLITEAIRLIDECRPKFFIWENVKGTFSSNNGADFWAIIQAFADLGNYRIEWQLLNTAWFLPQNRERIYLVGTLGNECGAEIFPIREKPKRINERTSKTTTARTFTAGGNSGGMHSSMTLLKVGAIRGRNPQNPKSIESGLNTVQQFEENNKGIANTLTSVQKDTVLKIKANTKKGFEEVKPGDSINYSVPASETRRGRVGKGKAQTLDTACNQAVIDKTKIRRLTEIECERLQGFKDNWTQYGIYDDQEKPVPATQRYKCLGNAVTVDVVQAVGERILKSIRGKK